MKNVLITFVCVVCMCIAVVGNGCRQQAASAPAFRMPVEDVFYIEGKGVLVTGTIADGTVAPGDDLQLVTPSGSHRPVHVMGVERFGESLSSASTGESVGVQLADLQKADVSRGDILVDQVHSKR